MGTVFDHAAAYGGTVQADTGAVAVALSFTPNADGQITRLYAYVPATFNTNQRTLCLYRVSDQVQLAAEAFTPDTANPGWQYVTLASPVSVVSGASYRVALHSPASGSGGNYTRSGSISWSDDGVVHDAAYGWYVYSSTPAFPGSSSGEWYWVDVDFTAGGSSNDRSGTATTLSAGFDTGTATGAGARSGTGTELSASFATGTATGAGARSGTGASLSAGFDVGAATGSGTRSGTGTTLSAGFSLGFAFGYQEPPPEATSTAWYSTALGTLPRPWWKRGGRRRVR